MISRYYRYVCWSNGFSALLSSPHTSSDHLHQHQHGIKEMRYHRALPLNVNFACYLYYLYLKHLNMCCIKYLIEYILILEPCWHSPLVVL
ncbi:hypothetical protein Scep_019825 [Stephania cephalantha]|uniref:Uncharacterized protein n=1 Tax=Stephania cephalantha TaxID=152367 RepID=A0AAP0ICG8_9MAGN